MLEFAVRLSRNETGVAPLGGCVPAACGVSGSPFQP